MKTHWQAREKNKYINKDNTSVEYAIRKELRARHYREHHKFLHNIHHRFGFFFFFFSLLIPVVLEQITPFVLLKYDHVRQLRSSFESFHAVDLSMRNMTD